MGKRWRLEERDCIACGQRSPASFKREQARLRLAAATEVLQRRASRERRTPACHSVAASTLPAR